MTSVGPKITTHSKCTIIIESLSRIFQIIISRSSYHIHIYKIIIIIERKNDDIQITS